MHDETNGSHNSTVYWTNTKDVPASTEVHVQSLLQPRLRSRAFSIGWLGKTLGPMMAKYS